MKSFNDIKNIWSEIKSDPETTTPFHVDRKRDQLSLLKKQYGLSALGLVSLTAFILWFAFLSDKDFVYDLSYIALVLIATCSIIMVLVNLHNVLLISRIDETMDPKEYLDRWFKFYKKRLRFFSLYGPALFFILCISFGLYVPEILGYYPTANYKIGFVFFLLMIFLGYIVLGKNAVKEEKMKLDEIGKNMRMLFEE
jgi:hypothetical protein